MLQKVDTKRLTAGLIMLTFLVIAVGGLMRVSDAGICPDWPTCFSTWGSILAPRSKKDGGTKIDEITRGEHHRIHYF